MEKTTGSKSSSKRINNVEGLGTVNGHVAQNLCRCSKESDTSLEDKARSERSSVVEDGTLCEIVK